MVTKKKKSVPVIFEPLCITKDPRPFFSSIPNFFVKHNYWPYSNIAFISDRSQSECKNLVLAKLVFVCTCPSPRFTSLENFTINYTSSKSYRD